MESQPRRDERFLTGQGPITKARKRTFTETLQNLYLKSDFADVHFVFHENGEMVRIPAHRLLLATRSDVFGEMLYGGGMEEIGDISMTGTSVAAFKEFLQFFYVDGIKLTLESIYDVICLCQKFNVRCAFGLCENFLENSLCVRNACKCLGLAISLNYTYYKYLCKAFIEEETEAVLTSSGFLECPQSTLEYILTQIKLCSCSESMIFEACMAWVKNVAKTDNVTRETVDNHLGALFFEIRFGSMDMEEFLEITRSHENLFTTEEYQDIVQTITSTEFKPMFFKNVYPRASPRGQMPGPESESSSEYEYSCASDSFAEDELSR